MEETMTDPLNRRMQAVCKLQHLGNTETIHSAP